MAGLTPQALELEGAFTHRYLHARGIRLHAVEAGSPSDPLVLLLHDAFGNWADYLEVLPLIAQQGYHVVALDFRGYGLSDKPPVEASFGIRTLVSDVVGAVAALGHSTAHLVGCDSGGAVAWVMASTHPQRVSSVTAISAAHPHDLRAAVRRRPWDYMVILGRHGLHRQWMRRLIGVRFTLGQVRAFVDVNVTASFRGTEAYRANFKHRITGAKISNVGPAMIATAALLLAPVRGRLTHQLVQAPVLLLHPEQSLWPRLTPRMRRRLAPGARLDTASVPEAKNLPHVEAPGAFVEELVRFLGSSGSTAPRQS